MCVYYWQSSDFVHISRYWVVKIRKRIEEWNNNSNMMCIISLNSTEEICADLHCNCVSYLFFFFIIQCLVCFLFPLHARVYVFCAIQRHSSFATDLLFNFWEMCSLLKKLSTFFVKKEWKNAKKQWYKCISMVSMFVWSLCIVTLTIVRCFVCRKCTVWPFLRYQWM